MEYFVVMPDGSKFGPASIETLNEWAAQGRILPTTVIERASDGVQGPASMLPGLILPAGAGTPPAAGTSEPAAPQAPVMGQQPAAPQAPVYGTPAPAHGPGAGQDTYSGYPRQQIYSPNQVPYELQGKFNWGAFFFTWIWGLNHRAYIPLAVIGIGVLQGLINVAAKQVPALAFVSLIISLANLGFCIWIGTKGYEWAWQSGRFATPDECKKCQTIWGWWALGMFIFTCICVIALFVLGVAAGISGMQSGGARFR